MMVTTTKIPQTSLEQLLEASCFRMQSLVSSLPGSPELAILSHWPENLSANEQPTQSNVANQQQSWNWNPGLEPDSKPSVCSTLPDTGGALLP